MLGTDTITLYKKQPEGSFVRYIVPKVQWSSKNVVTNENGRISVARYITITFFEGTYEALDLTNFTDEDAILYGEIPIDVTEVRGHRMSDLLRDYPMSGIIKSVNDNSHRTYLKNIKVVLT